MALPARSFRREALTNIESKQVHRRESDELPAEKNRLPKKDVQKYDSTPLYLYTAKDALNRVTVLKELARDAYLIAGRYSGNDIENRLYSPLSKEEGEEIEKLVRIGRKDAVISFL